jgi:membrane-associated phospholipid phosphatase
VEQTPEESLWLMPRWLLLLAVAMFGGLSIFAAGSGVLPGDEPVLDAVQSWPRTPWQIVFDIGNLFGTTPVSPVVLLGLACIGYWRRNLPAIVFCLVLLTFRFIGMLAKGLFDSPRPTAPLAEIRHQFDGLGYPSGHALTATIVAGACTVILPRLMTNRPAVRIALALVWIWAITCGLARIWYAAHWPSDVLGGFLLGLIMLGCSGEITRAILHRFQKDWYRHRT